MKKSAPAQHELLFAIDAARSAINDGKELPAYLTEALARFSLHEWKRIDQALILPKLVDRAAHEGLPRSRNTIQVESAFQAAAKKLGMTEATVERHYQQGRRRKKP